MPLHSVKPSSDIAQRQVAPAKLEPTKLKISSPSLSDAAREPTSASDTGYLKTAGQSMSQRLRAAKVSMQDASTDQAAAVGADKKEPTKNESHVFAQATSLAGAIVASIKSNPGIYSVALGSVALGGYAALKNKTSLEPPLNEKSKPANPSQRINAYIRNGTFGTLKIDATKINGVAVSRGDDMSQVFNDPNNPQAGIILCPKARKYFNSHKNNPKYQSEQGRFALAMLSAIKVREAFLKKNVMGTGGQNDLASIHVTDSKAIRGGSPFLSLTVNEFVAGYFAAGGIDNAGHEVPPHRNGKVFKSSVNNESTVFPIVAGKVKGVHIGQTPQKMADLGFMFTDKLKTPFGELVIVGGFYFNDAIEMKEALQKGPQQFHSASDLENMSSQMFDADKNANVEYLDFSRQAWRLLRQQAIDFNNLN